MLIILSLRQNRNLNNRLKKIFSFLFILSISINLRAQTNFEKERSLLDSISAELNWSKNFPFKYGIISIDNSNKKIVRYNEAVEGLQMDSCFCHCYCQYIIPNTANFIFFRNESLIPEKFNNDGTTLLLIYKNSKGKEKEIPMHLNGMSQGERLKKWFTELSQLCKE